MTSKALQDPNPLGGLGQKKDPALHEAYVMQQQEWERWKKEIVDERAGVTPHQREAYNQNPKNVQQLKEGKTPYECVPLSTLEGLARVMAHGAAKYGKYNWREQKILASTYKAAIMRHLVAWSEGQHLDPDSGDSHLHHIMACCVVALDAIAHGTFKDDLLDQETKQV